VFLRTVATTFQPLADLSTQSLPKPPEVPVMTMVRGTLASYGGVTSWPTLGSPSPRPNPQKLLVLARDPLIVVARDRKAAGYR
jgi:hypothetical protein